jgi:hypothetical protein
LSDERKQSIEELIRSLEDKPWVKLEDLEKMINALSAYRGGDWWYETENDNGARRCLSPMVLQNMHLGLEAGTLVPSVNQYRNLLTTAMHYSHLALNQK